MRQILGYYQTTAFLFIIFDLNNLIKLYKLSGGGGGADSESGVLGGERERGKGDRTF